MAMPQASYKIKQVPQKATRGLKPRVAFCANEEFSPTRTRFRRLGF
jgi:hypothetical protein